MPKYKMYKRKGGVSIGIPVARNPGLSKTQAKSVRKIAKKTVMGSAETKTVGKQTENVQLNHNKALYFS